MSRNGGNTYLPIESAVSPSTRGHVNRRANSVIDYISGLPTYVRRRYDHNDRLTFFVACTLDSLLTYILSSLLVLYNDVNSKF